MADYGRQHSNVFTEIGLIILAGLSARDVMRIAEFLSASLNTKVVRWWRQRAEASRMRLQLILMSPLAFLYHGRCRDPRLYRESARRQARWLAGACLRQARPSLLTCRIQSEAIAVRRQC
jgi:hypothetical protein